MANEKRLIDTNELKRRIIAFATGCHTTVLSVDSVVMMLNQSDTVDAVEMPKGKPGDYLEWDNGTGIKQIYCIHAVMICKDCMRYDLEKFSPVVDHPNIVRILSLEQAEQEWREMCAKAMPREEPTFTAVCGERKDNG